MFRASQILLRASHKSRAPGARYPLVLAHPPALAPGHGAARSLAQPTRGSIVAAGRARTSVRRLALTLTGMDTAGREYSSSTG
jgi:hypothetical protein